VTHYVSHKGNTAITTVSHLCTTY